MKNKGLSSKDPDESSEKTNEKNDSENCVGYQHKLTLEQLRLAKILPKPLLAKIPKPSK